VLSVSVAADGGFFTTFWDLIVKFFSGTPTGAATFGTAATITTGACFTASGLGAVAGDTIDLSNDISTGSGNCAVIDVFNVTFNCTGFTISNTGSASDGIRITAANATVVNCIVRNFTSDNIEITSTGDNFTIRNVTVLDGSGGSTDGIALSTADNGLIEDSTINNNTGRIINWASSNDGIIRNNTLNGTGTTGTVNIASSSNVLVQNNNWTTDRDNSSDSIDTIGGFNNNYLTVRDHVNVSMRFNIGLCNNCTITNNTLSGNGLISVFGGNNSVTYNSWSTVDIEGQTSGGIDIGQSSIGTSSGSVAHNTILNGQMMSIAVSSNVDVFNNTLANISGVGFEITGQNSTIQNNTITNFSGIVFKVFNESTSQAYNNTIANNTVVFNLKVLNTSFNLAGLSTPALPEGTLGISISGDVDDTEIFGNSFSVVNPASLPVGVIGVMSTNGSANTVIRENTFAGLQSAVSITDATGLSIYRNAITDSTYKAVSVLFSDLVQIYNNSISAASPTYGPSQFESGVEVVDTLLSGPIVQYNNISGYHSGIFLLGADSSKVLDNNVTSASFGVFSVGGLSVNVTNLTVDSTVEVGVKFLFTNSSFVMNSTLGSSNSGVEFYMSNSNSLNGSTIGSASVGMLFDLSSSSNSVGDNVFPGNPNDVVCDMFSSTNTGTGNGGPSVVEENGASGCTIT
jgi:hypothetical protein